MIEVKGLTKQFKGQTVLNGIDLNVQPGEVVAIIGPSGSGKTTFLRCLNLLETPMPGRSRSAPSASMPTAHWVGSRVRYAACANRRGSCSELQPVPSPHRPGERDRGPGHRQEDPREQAIDLGRRLLAKVGLAGKEDAYPGACPVASSSGWPSPAPWPWSRR